MGRTFKYTPIDPEKKVCPTCGDEKAKTEFGVRVKAKDGRRAQCKQCRTDLERPGNIKRKYGISIEEYNAMYETQKGRCACCGQSETAVHWKGKKRQLAIDHNHATGRVRQLICHRCNIILGLAKEDPELLKQTADYIIRHLTSVEENKHACNI